MGILQNALNQAPVPPVIQQSNASLCGRKREFYLPYAYLLLFLIRTNHHGQSERETTRQCTEDFNFCRIRKTRMAASKIGAVKTIRKDGGCKALLQTVTTGNVFTKFKPHDGTCAHNHALDEEGVTLSIIKSNLKRRAVERERSDGATEPQLQSAPLAVCPSLSSSAVRRQSRVRIANQIPIVEGRNVQDIDIPRESRMYTDGAGRQQLFLGNSGRDDAENSAVRKRKHIDWSGEMKLMYLDGLFR
uniref:Uncharacterized protein n=1 Tax=Ditylenchus dipsaci TaxID=166011 RepID=A0A915DGA4_9BILA